ncbi:MAG: sulfurase [Candidatus Pelagibacter sp.]|nr:sulfurase [Candidatus Pelagibacter sp.]
MFKINQLYYSPVKSLSFSSVNKLEIINNIGIKFDRNFAFTRDLDDNKINYLLQNPLERQIINFLSLKHLPKLNEYNFDFNNGVLNLKKNNKVILSTNINDKQEISILCNKMQEIIPKVERIRLLQDSINPFYDTMPSKTISLINLNSIKDFERKLSRKVEFQRFRGNIYIDGLNAWEERDLVNKTLIINNIKFKVTKEIPRCVATNIKPNSSKINLSIPISLKQFYNHINLGIYLMPLNDGIIKLNDDILIDG